MFGVGDALAELLLAVAVDVLRRRPRRGSPGWSRNSDVSVTKNSVARLLQRLAVGQLEAERDGVLGVRAHRSRRRCRRRTAPAAARRRRSPPSPRRRGWRSTKASLESVEDLLDLVAVLAHQRLVVEVGRPRRARSTRSPSAFRLLGLLGERRRVLGQVVLDRGQVGAAARGLLVGGRRLVVPAARCSDGQRGRASAAPLDRYPPFFKFGLLWSRQCSKAFLIRAA